MWDCCTLIVHLNYLLLKVDNKTDSDSTSSEYYGTSPVNLNVDTMSNASRTRQFVENLPSNVSSPKSASFQTDTPNPGMCVNVDF